MEHLKRNLLVNTLKIINKNFENSITMEQYFINIEDNKHYIKGFNICDIYLYYINNFVIDENEILNDIDTYFDDKIKFIGFCEGFNR